MEEGRNQESNECTGGIKYMLSGRLMHSDSHHRNKKEKVGHTCQSVGVARNAKQNDAEARKDGKEQKSEKMARERLVGARRFHSERKDKPTEIQVC